MDGRSPLQRYEHGVHAQDVFPPAGLPDIPADPDTLRISLMPYETRVVTQATVEINGHKYYSNDLKLISDERDPDAPTSQRKFEVRFDPRDLSCIWVWNPATQLYVKAVNTNRSLGSISLWEWRARKKKQKGLTDVYEDRRYESALRRDEFIESQRKLTKSARKEAEKRKDRAANSLVRQLEPAAPESKPSPSEPTRPSLSQDRLAAMRDKVKISGGKK
jgi:putative transposase